MSAAEIAGHARKKLRQFADARWERDWAGVSLESTGKFPALPAPAAAPAALRTALRRDADDILAGRWRAFGQLELKVDDPPRWHCDYLAGKDFSTSESAFSLDHRALPGGADIKLIWELSRWHQLTRFAQAAHVLGDEKAGEKCVLWLEDWVKHNPPYRGWNWTSALEAGLRLIQFTWMDALLEAQAKACGYDAELERLRYEILPAHAWFAWRHKSFGSSANNHLIGELAGLIVATVRWPALAQWGAPLAELQRRWEREVLAQFHEDGGNKEQALNYHLFSWELCWHARAALVAAGRAIAPAVDERLRRAAQFYVDVQVPSDPWDYGDSDNAIGTPFCANETCAVQEWHAWLSQPERSAALEYWWGAARRDFKLEIQDLKSVESGWKHYKESGQQVWRSDDLTLRVDVSNLGYLATAAHGHLDALHLSLWRKGVALVVDAGTGCYYADQRLRGWLASHEAHNGPCALPDLLPQRFGAFLWSANHGATSGTFGRTNCTRLELVAQHKKFLKESGLDESHLAEFERAVAELHSEKWTEDGTAPVLFLPSASHALSSLMRFISLEVESKRFTVSDSALGRPGEGVEFPFVVRWQFAPGAKLERLAERRFRVSRRGVAMEVKVSADWAEVFPVAEISSPEFARAATSELEREFAGIVSPAFRQTEWAPFLKLVARPGEKPCVFTTTFLASADA